MQKTIPRRPVSILGVRLDLGAGRRGTDMGPSAVRLAGLHSALEKAGFLDVEDLGDVDTPAKETLAPGDEHAKYLAPIAAACRRVSKLVRNALERGRVPVVLGGDHSCAIGTVSGIVAHYRKTKTQVGIIWIDAHGDMNTPDSSGSGNVHGMPLAALLGLGPKELTEIDGKSPKLDAKRTVLVGIRDLDFKERQIVAGSGVNVFTMSDIDERGIAAVMRDAIALARGPDGAGPYHVSFDLDGVDPQFAPGVGTAVEGGVTYREAHLAMELVAVDGGACSVEMVEINPILDVGNRTGRLAMELVLSALGKRIYFS
jgi:arginase